MRSVNSSIRIEVVLLSLVSVSLSLVSVSLVSLSLVVVSSKVEDCVGAGVGEMIGGAVVGDIAVQEKQEQG
jgi:hypothetical protein